MAVLIGADCNYVVDDFLCLLYQNIFLFSYTGPEKEDSYSFRKRKTSKNYTEQDNDSDEGGPPPKVPRLPNLSPYQQKMERLKADGRLEEHREVEKKRVAVYRMSRTPLQIKESNAKQAIRQQRYRENQKRKKENECTTRKSAEKFKQEEEAKKKARNAYMREYRSKQTPEKKAEINAKRKQRYQQNKAASLPSTSSADSSHPNFSCFTPPKSSNQGSPYKTDSAKRQAACRSSKVDPKDPSKFAQMHQFKLKIAMKDPQKADALAKEGIYLRDDGSVPNTVQNIHEHLDAKKKSNTKKDVDDRKRLVKIMIKNSTKSISALSKELNQRWHFVASASLLDLEKEELETTKRSSALPEDICKEVNEFYSRPESCIIVPDKKMVTKDLVPKAVLTKSIKDLYKDFKRDSNAKMSLSMFKKLRPQHILTMDKLKHTSCLCKICANFAQKLEALKPHLPNGFSTKLMDVVNLTLCPKGEQRHASWSCIDRECNHCSAEDIRAHLKELPMTNTIKWLRWQNYTESDGKERLGNVTKQVRVIC